MTKFSLKPAGWFGGNVLNRDILGSMEFACKVSGAKLIAVIGHSNCGAIKGAAVDNLGRRFQRFAY